jgi:hypothetical protein
MTTDPTCDCGAPLAAGALRCPACGRDAGAFTERPERADSRITDEHPEPSDDTPLTGGEWARDVSLPAGLVSPGAVFGGVFLCGPMAGVLLLAYNDGVLRRRWRGWAALLAGALYCFLEGGVYHILAPDTPEWRFSGVDVAVALVNLVLLTTVAAVLHGKAARARKGAGPSVWVIRALVGMALSWLLVTGGAYAAW